MKRDKTSVKGRPIDPVSLEAVLVGLFRRTDVHRGVTRKDLLAALPPEMRKDPSQQRAALLLLREYLSSLGVLLLTSQASKLLKEERLPAGSGKRKELKPEQEEKEPAEVNVDNLFSDYRRKKSGSDNLLAVYFRQIRRYKRLTPEKEHALGYLAEQGDKEARNELVLGHLPYAIAMAKRFRGRGAEFIDLIQEANYALIRAAEYWSPRLANRFVTLATYRIRRHCMELIEERSQLIRPTRGRVRTLLKVYHARNQWLMRYGSEPMAADLAEMLSLPKVRVRQALTDLFNQHVSLDAAIKEDSAQALYDVIPDYREGQPEETVVLQDMQKEAVARLKYIESRLQVFPESDRLVFRLRYGLSQDYDQPLTMAEVAALTDLSESRVSQVLKKAWARINHGVVKPTPVWRESKHREDTIRLTTLKDLGKYFETA